MKKTALYTLTILFLSGCTQVVTAPISVAGAVAGTTIDVAGATIGAVACSND